MQYAYYYMMETQTKRRRVVVSIRRSTIWTEMLRVWSKLCELPSLKNESNHKCSRFVIFSGKRNETIVEVQQIQTEGQHSEIYEIVFNGVKQNALLKHFTSSCEVNVTPVFEAQLQMYACKHGFAPPVLAWNHTGMISGLCETSLETTDLEDGYIWNKQMKKDFDAKNVCRRLCTLNKALGSGIQRILSFTKKMHEEIGMYNMDPNLSNYMFWRGKLVQIDFGMNRFANETAFKKWASTMNITSALQNTFVLKNTPASPADYYWYETFVSNGCCDTSKWTALDWNSYHMNLPNERRTLIDKLEKKQMQQAIEKAKCKTKFKTFCVLNGNLE